VDIPVIASGGAGRLPHLSEAITEARADAVLVASIFHYGEYRVRDAKEHLHSAGIPVRL
jgi:cyclase